MLVDSLLFLAVVILQILLIPLMPIFLFIPSPETVIGPIPTFMTTSLDQMSIFLYYLNLGPFLTFVMILVGGMITLRVAIAVFDIILPPIPVIGSIYVQLMSFIRGFS